MFAALLLAAAVVVAPTPTELEALQAPPRGAKVLVRDVHCRVLGDPTEHRCTWRQRTSAKGRWETWSAILARDGGRWILIDTPSPASRP